MSYRIRNIGLAIGLALIAALLVSFYVSNYRKNVQQAEGTVKVWVASLDIPAGTPGSEVVGKGMLKSVDVAKRNVAPGAIATPDQIAQLVAVDPVYAGEQVTTRRFATVEEKGIRSQIAGTARAIQVPGDKHQLLVGVLQAGDRVDVVGSFNVPEANQHHYSRTILRDILVLRAASTQGGAAEKITSGPTAASALAVILALTDSQAQKIFWLMQNGEWSLELRPTDDPADSPQTVESAETLLLDGLKTEQLKAVIALAQNLLPESERIITDEQR